MTLQCYVFASSTPSHLTQADLADLYARTAACNLPRGLGGALLYGDGNVMEYLEGPADAIVQARSRILASRRHVGVLELMHEPIVQRVYLGWDLATPSCGTHPGLAAATQRWTQQSELLGAAQSHGLFLLRVFWSTAVSRH